MCANTERELLGGGVGMVVDSYALRLRRIRFEANVGASVEERSVRQELVVDLDLALGIEALPERDTLSDAVDYEAAVRLVVEEGVSRSYQLLETYAKRAAARLLDELPVRSVRMVVTKKKVPTKYPVAEAMVELVAGRPTNGRHVHR